MSSTFWKDIFQPRILYPAHISTKHENGVSILDVWGLKGTASHAAFLKKPLKGEFCQEEPVIQERRHDTKERNPDNGKSENPRKMVKGSFTTASCRLVWDSSGQCDPRDRHAEDYREFLFSGRTEFLVEFSPDFHMSSACLDRGLMMVLLPLYALLGGTNWE